jgi:hypothetical protein
MRHSPRLALSTGLCGGFGLFNQATRPHRIKKRIKFIYGKVMLFMYNAVERVVVIAAMRVRENEKE